MPEEITDGAGPRTSVISKLSAPKTAKEALEREKIARIAYEGVLRVQSRERLYGWK
jgi:hypothetical protein